MMVMVQDVMRQVAGISRSLIVDVSYSRDRKIDGLKRRRMGGQCSQQHHHCNGCSDKTTTQPC